MANQPGVWGIDLGQCALKAVRLEVADGQVKATAFDYVEHPKILSQPDADPDQLTREALEKFLSRNKLKGDVVAISVPGQSGLARFVKLPPVEEKKITDIVKFEAKQQIPFPLEEVVWDYQKIGSGTVTDGFAMETEIGLFAIKRDMVSRALQHFRDVGVEVHVVQMSPLALCNFVSYDLLGKGGPELLEDKKKKDDKAAADKAAGDGEEKAEEEEEEQEKPEDDGKKHCAVALDIGADNSNLVVTDGEKIIWQRPIPIGGNHFTRALTKDLKLTFAKAEHLKRNATKSPDLRKILGSLKPVLNDFAGEIQRSLGYFTNTHRHAHVDYMVGLGSAFRLPGLQKFLSEKLQLEVRKYQKPERLAGDEVLTAPAFSENVLSFGVAYGLALQGLAVTRLRTNLLPHELHVERLVRSKKPWAAAAAAVLLLGVAGLMIGYAKEHRAVDTSVDPLDGALKDQKAACAEVGEWKSKCSNEEKEIEANILAVKSVLAGQDEQFNWLYLNPFISECLPLPDGMDVNGIWQPLIYGKVTKAWANDKKEIVIQGTNSVVYHCQLPPADAKMKAEVVEQLYGKDDKPLKEVKTLKSISDLKEGDDVWVAAYYVNPKIKDVKYWNKKAQQAGEFFKKRQAGSLEDNAAPPDAGIDDLLQVNIEAVTPRFCDDLSKIELYSKLDDRSKAALKQKGLPEAALQKAPEGAGWVVELRGYTYHKERNLFLLDSIVTKLNALRSAEREVVLTKICRIKPGTALRTDDPIDGRISHALLYEYTPVTNPQPGSFKLINDSVVKGVIGAGRANDWSPLGGSKSSGSGGLGGAAGAPGAAGSSSRGGQVGGPTGSSYKPGETGGPPLGPSTPGGRPAGGAAVGPGGVGLPGGAAGGERRENRDSGSADQTVAGPSKHTRTEFIILFIWKEPTPSDKLMSPGGETAVEPSGGTPGGGMPGGPMDTASVGPGPPAGMGAGRPVGSQYGPGDVGGPGAGARGN
jgi:type IV pilus assembly protein PilM